MENQTKKPWFLGKLNQIIILTFIFRIVEITCKLGFKKIFRKEYVDGIYIVFIGLTLLFMILETRYALIYDKEATIERLKKFWTKQRIIDILIPVIFGILLLTFYFFFLKN